MNINDWIEIDSDYTWYIHEKAKVIAEQGQFFRNRQKNKRAHSFRT